MFKISTACGSLLQSCQMAFFGKADQINWSAFLNLLTVFGFCAACVETPALPPKLIIDNWLRLSEFWPLIIGDEVMAIWLAETWNFKQQKQLVLLEKLMPFC